jgi:hypothetical protein
LDLLDVDDENLNSLGLRPLEVKRFRKLQAELQPQANVVGGDPALNSSAPAPALSATELLAPSLACEEQPPCSDKVTRVFTLPGVWPTVGR